jgi:hypothetical protein
MTERDEQLDVLARGHHGLVTTEDLCGLGFSPREIGVRCRSGHLHRVYESVYRCQGVPPSWHQDLLAACLAAGPGAVASHRAALPLWGMDLRVGAPLEVSVPRERFPRPRHVVMHRSLDLTPDFTEIRQGIPTTNPYRLLVDLGAVLPAPFVGRALDDFLGRGLVRIDAVRAVRDALGKQGRRGAGVLREVLAERYPRHSPVESILERKFLDLCHRFGLPIPVAQYPVLVEGSARRLDFAYPDDRVGIELDGYRVHADRDRFEDDRERGNALEIAGWRLLHFTWTQVDRHAERVARTVGAMVPADRAFLTSTGRILGTLSNRSGT